MMTLVEQFASARKVGVPLIGIETPDPMATILSLLESPTASKFPVLQWDLVRGLSPVNPSGENWIKSEMPNPDERRALTANPTEALDFARRLPERAILFVHNAQRYLDAEGPAQAVWNLRDPFKENGRTLVLLAPALRLPAELERDVIVLEEPLPDDLTRKGILERLHQDAGVPIPDDATMARAVEASRGLAAFPTEQVAAMSLTREGLNLDRVWALKRKMIEQTRGLSLSAAREVFDEIGGLDRAKAFGRLLFAGNARPSCVVFIDEIEKALAGATGGDTSGVSQDFLGVILSAMEDHNWTGLIAVGPPGCAKSMYGKALGKTHGVPVIQFDLGALKGSLVGQSEMQMRQAVRTIKAVAGESAFFVATCNKLDRLPPELRRRFRQGVWYFDLPDADERTAIWRSTMERYGLTGDRKVTRDGLPDDAGWTGADIRNVCENAWRLKISLTDAAAYITPVSKSDPDSIRQLRELADGRFLSASYPGFYRKPGASDTPASKPSRRKMQLT